jgi:hypothetical protein
VSSDERFKALAGTSASGLHVFASGDGLRWRRWREGSVLTQGAFDSQNVAFWSESEHCYAAYFRTWTGGAFAGYRTISRATSPDLVHWSGPAEMSFGDTPREHLYTSQTHPYFRAPHVYLATPMRFMPGRKVLTSEQAGDDTERAVTWKTGSELGPLAGTPVRLHFVMKDADLFSLRFR